MRSYLYPTLDCADVRPLVATAVQVPTGAQTHARVSAYPASL